MQPYERFDAWQFAHRLVLLTYRVTGGFPASERYGLTSQSRRAAFSIAANLAEGSAKRGSREFRRYLDMAVGSLSELSYALRVARDLGMVSDQDWESIQSLRDTTSKIVWGLYRAIARGGDLPSARPPVRPSATSSRIP